MQTSERFFAAGRLGLLFVKIRDELREFLDAFQCAVSGEGDARKWRGFCLQMPDPGNGGTIDCSKVPSHVFLANFGICRFNIPVSETDIETAACYLEDFDLRHDAQRLRDEFQLLKRAFCSMGDSIQLPDGVANRKFYAQGCAAAIGEHVSQLIGAANATAPVDPQGAVAITVDEANRVAKKLAKQDPGFLAGGVRQWAAAIRKATGKTCSNATVQETPLRIETMKKTGRGRTKGKTPRALALTIAMEATIGENGPEVMGDLIAGESKVAERRAAIEAVQQSQMTPEQQTATLERLARGEMTPEQAKETASLFPRKRAQPVKPFRRV